VNIKISVNNDSGKFFKKNSSISGKLNVAVYALVVYVYISCTCLSIRLECNYLFVGLGVWGVRGSKQKNLAVSRWMISGMGSVFRV
jgi:hypothetical protein